MHLRSFAASAATLALALALSGCVYTRAYVSPISTGVFRVHAETNGLGGNSGDVTDHALYEAAKATIERGGRYFVVQGESRDQNRYVSAVNGVVWVSDQYLGDFVVRIVTGPGANVFDARDIVATMSERFEPKTSGATKKPAG